MMSPLLLRTNLPQTFTIYDIQALRNLSEDFQEDFSLYFDQKKHSSTAIFWRNIKKWMAQSKRKISKKTFLVESFQYNRYSEQSLCVPKEGLYHQESFENGWLLTSSYATRNVDCIPRIKIKHNFFKNNFFPSAIIEQNKLDPAIRNAESLDFFKINILKFFRPTPRRFFNCYNHKGIRRLTFFSTVHYLMIKQSLS